MTGVYCPLSRIDRAGDVRIIELEHGHACVRIAPDLGGSITAFTWRDRPVLRPTPSAALADRNVRLASCYPLVPYSNRIRNARLVFRGRDYALARNFGAHPHAIHGVGWQRSWSVTGSSPQRMRLSLTHAAAEAERTAWPWPFIATQTFHLAGGDGARDATILALTLTLDNVGTEAFPFGLGWHPFLPKDAATRLRFSAQAVWQNDATQLPRERIALPPQWRFDRSRPLGDVALDNVFAGWDGAAELASPANGITTTLAADRACGWLVVYAPPAGDFIALEPVSHETDAFNRAATGASDTGFRVLPPGAAFSCTMRVAVAAIA